MMGIDDAWGHESENRKFLVAKREQAHHRRTLLTGVIRSKTRHLDEVHLAVVETGVLHLGI